MKSTIKVECEIKVPFESYGTKKLDNKAKKDILRWIKSALEDVRYIPLYVEKDEDGSAIEDCTKRSSIHVRGDFDEV